MTGLRNPVGTHVKVGPGLARGTLRQARELGLEALQVFTGNPRGWALSEGKSAEDAAFREGCAAECGHISRDEPLMALAHGRR